MQTVLAPEQCNGYFTQWRIQSIRIEDAQGRAVNPATFIIYETTEAVAEYVSATLDLDADGIPDWFEILCFANTNSLPTDDVDADGLSLEQEYMLDTPPLIPDSLNSGGLSRRRSSSVHYSTIYTHDYLEYSEPSGIFSRSLSVSNTEVVTTYNFRGAHPSSSQYSFGYWTVNGQRQQDALGQALTRTIITVTSDVDAVGHFYLGTQDTDVDAVPDWFEWYSCGSLTNNANGDNDGDEISLIDEYQLDLCAVIADDLQSGGLSRRRSAAASLNISDFITCSYVSDPSGILLYTEELIPTGTVVSTPDISFVSSSNSFIYWTVNGERMVDDIGMSATKVIFAVTGDTECVAHYCLTEQDSDVDLLPDWFEYYYYGDLAQSATNDMDGDGIMLLDEYALNLSPVVYDGFAPGHLSRRRSASCTLNLQFYEKIIHIPVEGVLTRFFSRSSDDTNAMNFGLNTAPAIGDWDGDGDLDLFIGSRTNEMQVYENQGSRNSVRLRDATFLFSQLAISWSDIDSPYPALGDWNNDGKADLVVGGDVSHIQVMDSSGIFSSAVPWSVSYSLPISSSSSAIPGFLDVNSDTNLDLLVLDDTGHIRVYLNSGSASVPYMSVAFTNDLLGVEVPGATGLGVGDTSGDGVPDILVSDIEGRIWEFRQSGPLAFTLKSKIWAGTGSGFAENLSLCVGDLDADSDCDAICGFDQGGLFGLRNPPLGAPSGLTVEAGAISILLDWDAISQSRLKGYNVYWSDTETNTFVCINTNTVMIPSYEDGSPIRDVTNRYYVTALTHAMSPGFSTPMLCEGPGSAIVSGVPGRVEMWMPDSFAQSGSNVILSISLNNASGVSGTNMFITVNYDTTLTPLSQVSSNTTILRTDVSRDLTFTSTVDVASGALQISGIAGELIGQGHILDLVFWVTNSAANGIVITNSFGIVQLYDVNGNEIEVDSSALSRMSITSVYFLGDVEGDGDIDQQDFMLFMYLRHEHTRDPTAAELSAGDMNSNGRFDSQDIPLFRRLLREGRLCP